MKISAGILPFKFEKNVLKVYLGHMGGPFWAKKDEGAWSILKGEVEKGEDILEAAKREFYEESGKKIDRKFIDLGETKTENKILHIFAIEKDLDTNIKSNFFKIEWPPKSNQYREFPEIDRVKWFDIDKAYKKIVKSQRVFLDRLSDYLKKSGKNI